MSAMGGKQTGNGQSKAVIRKSQFTRDALLVAGFGGLAIWFTLDSDILYRKPLALVALLACVIIIWRLRLREEADDEGGYREP